MAVIREDKQEITMERRRRRRRRRKKR